MYGWHCRENCCSHQLLKEQGKKRSSSFQTVLLWLLPLWLSVSVLILVMGPHLRNERFFHWLYCWVGNCQFVVVVLSVFCLSVGVYRSTGTWSLPHHHPTSSALHVLVYICIVSTALTVCYDSTYFLLPYLSSSRTVGLVPEACRIFNTYPALFRILCSSGLLFSISLSWILFFFTSGHCSRMEYWMLPLFHPFFSALQFFIFCIVHVQPFFCSFDVETSFCLWQVVQLDKILKFVAQLPFFPCSSGLPLLHSLAVCSLV